MSRYDEIRERATRLAGEPDAFAQRVALLHSIYVDSKGNHAFPQVALHGALWASAFFSVTGTMGRIISYRYFYNSAERRRRHQMLTEFAEAFKITNRSVFIDTWSNYFYTKEFGHDADAGEMIPPPLVEQLNKVHQAVREDRPLNASDRLAVFESALRWEQEATVGPGVQQALGRIDCPVLTMFLLKPMVRFEYFPRLRYFLFRNFSDTEERIRQAIRAYQIAERVSWERVVATMKNYGVLPHDFFENPGAFIDRLYQQCGASTR